MPATKSFLERGRDALQKYLDRGTLTAIEKEAMRDFVQVRQLEELEHLCSSTEFGEEKHNG